MHTKIRYYYDRIYSNKLKLSLQNILAYFSVQSILNMSYYFLQRIPILYLLSKKQ
jgi:hypothetical protein